MVTSIFFPFLFGFAFCALSFKRTLGVQFYRVKVIKTKIAFHISVK